MSTQKNLDKVFEAYLITFGIFIGLFFKFVYQHTLDNYKTIINLKELLYAYDISGIPLDFIINESFDISNDVILFVFIGILFLFTLLLSIKLSTDIIQKKNYLFVLVFLIVIFSWCLFPIFIMKTTLNEQALLIKFDIENDEINVDLVNQYYKFLDEYRYFGIRYIYEVKLLTYFTLMLFYLIIIKKPFIKINNKINIIGVFIPIITFMILNYFYLTSDPFTLYETGEIAFTVGRGKLLSHPLIVEPFKSYNLYLAIILTVIYFISLGKTYMRTPKPQLKTDGKKNQVRLKKPRKRTRKK